jgi:hypothetical protein
MTDQRSRSVWWCDANAPAGSFDATAIALGEAIAKLRHDAGLPPLSDAEYAWLIHGLAFSRAAKRPRPASPHKTAEPWTALAKTYDELHDQLAGMNAADRSLRRWLDDERGKSRGRALFARRMVDDPPAAASGPERTFRDELALAAAFAFHYVTGRKPGRSNRTVAAPPGSRDTQTQQPGGLFVEFLKLVLAARGVSGSVDNLARAAITAMVKIRPEIGRKYP